MLRQNYFKKLSICLIGSIARQGTEGTISPSLKTRDPLQPLEGMIEVFTKLKKLLNYKNKKFNFVGGSYEN